MTLRHIQQQITSSQRSRLARLRALLVAGACFGLAACPLASGLPSANFPLGTSTEASSPAAGRDTAQSDSNQNAEKSSFEQFSDVPVPNSASLNLKKTLVLGSNGGWIGRLDYDTPFTMGKMYAFFEAEMPKFGWQPITVVRTTISTMTYSRDRRVMTLILTPLLTGGSNIQVTMAPTVSEQNG